jgi:folate-dependent phosphoribosylglycinamide formyltransferase PurN
MQQKKIILLASDCESSRWVYHALEAAVNLEAVIIEQPVSKIILAKNRIKKIGLITVTGQVLFSVIVVPVLNFFSKKRKAFLVKKYGLNGNEYNSNKIHRVSSVNDGECLAAIQLLKPDIIVVNGTRIISKKIIHNTDAVFVNMHVGITPYYRGSHGGYWALYNHDAANFGTTIHLIDAGVDTGAVIKQVFVKPEKADNFVTYPVLQAAIGIPALKEVLINMAEGNCETIKNTEKGKLYYQPTLWQYFTGPVK